MWLMLQQEKPDDFVTATGETHSAREFVEYAFNEVRIEIDWQGKDLAEKGIDKLTGKVLVGVGPRYFKPTEVELILSDPNKAKEKLN